MKPEPRERLYQILRWRNTVNSLNPSPEGVARNDGTKPAWSRRRSTAPTSLNLPKPAGKSKPLSGGRARHLANMFTAVRACVCVCKCVYVCMCVSVLLHVSASQNDLRLQRPPDQRVVHSAGFACRCVGAHAKPPINMNARDRN